MQMQILSKNDIRYHFLRYKDEIKKEKSEPNALQEGSDCAISKKSVSRSNDQPPVKKQKSNTQKSVIHIKEEISNDKSNIQTMKPSKTVEAESITREKDSKPYWNEYTKELSQKLLLPTKIDCVDIDSNWWNPSSRRLGLGSWFSVQMKQQIQTENLQMTCSLPSTTLWQNVMAYAQKKAEERESEQQSKTKKANQKRKRKVPSQKKKAEKSKKIRLYPNPKQRETLNKWFGTARWTYNQCLNGIQKEGIPRKKKNLRAKYLNEENYKNTDNRWVLETPFDIRDEAMHDVLKAYNSNFAKGKEHVFQIKFKKKKQPSDSIAILSKHWKGSGILFPRMFGKEPIKGAEPLPEKLEYDSRLQRNRYGEFYLCIPLPLEIRSESQTPKHTMLEEGIISLDPGVRTFMTGYSPCGDTYEWGKGDIGRIYRLCHSLDKLQSKWSQANVRHKQRYNMKRAGTKIRKKIRNLVDELHKKMVKWLVENFRVVLLPEFETQQMVKRLNRKIGSKTARAMLTWSHYRFKMRLLNKTREYPWCKILIVDENYTSKTCGCCGYLHQKLGSSKTFRCPKCRLETDRDIHAARNILLRFLTLNCERVESNDSTLRLHSFSKKMQNSVTYI